MNKIYIHKEDVWANAPTKMSSASRDIFEHFYKSIKYTFFHQFKDYQEIIGKIQNSRNWSSACSLAFSEASRTRQELVLPKYLDQSIPLPKEQEFAGNDVLEVNDTDYDHKIYSDFEDFYNNADHGYVKSKKGREICLRLYKCFIQEVSLETLTQQLHEELTETHKWNNYSIKALKEYREQSSPLSWHNWLSKYLDSHDFYTFEDSN